MKHPIVVAAAVLMTVTGSADARPEHSRGSFHDTARVVHVDPIESWREVPVERWVCKPRRHHRSHDNGGHNDYLLPTVIGGAVGGAIGSQVDHRGARAVTAAAGSAAGAMLGYGLSQVGQRRHDGHDRHEAEHHRHNKRCRKVTEYERRRHVDGYRVTYRYHGHEFTTRTASHPGRRIPVRVKLRPEV